MKYIHWIVIVLIVLTVSPAFAAKTTTTSSDWTIVRQADWATNFHDVTYFDPQHAYAVGDFGIIASSTDGGKSWVNQTSGVKDNLESVMFVDIKTGWIAGANGVILYTSNSGAKWQAQKTVSTANMTDVFFVNPKIGWAIGNEGNKGTIYHTVDGGTNWKSQANAELPLYKIHFIDPNTGWIVGGQGRSRGSRGGLGSIIMHTTDGGKTWTQQKVELQNALSSVYFTDKDNGWTFGSGGMFTTNDGGNTWSSLLPPWLLILVEYALLGDRDISDSPFLESRLPSLLDGLKFRD